MTPLKPNPLVTALAKELVSAVLVLDSAGAVQQVSPSQANDDEIMDALVADPSVPQLVTFAGFLGGKFDDRSGTTWRFLYLDPKLVTWLVVNEDDVVLHRKVQDVTMPSKDKDPILRDLVWLKSSASVSDGSGPPRPREIEAQFLRGDFIGAGDFSASLTGGTFSRATGLLCEVQTPGCCGRYTRPRP